MEKKEMPADEQPLGMKLLPTTIEEVIDEDKLVIGHEDDSLDGMSELSKEMNMYNRLYKFSPDWRQVIGPMDCSKPFSYNDNTYKSIEHALLAELVKMQDPEKAEQFAMDSESEAALKDARKLVEENEFANSDFISADNCLKWSQQRHEIFKRIAYSKFRVCKKARTALIMTYPAQLWVNFGAFGHHSLDMDETQRVVRVSRLEDIREYFVQEARPKVNIPPNQPQIGFKRQRTFDHLELKPPKVSAEKKTSPSSQEDERDSAERIGDATVNPAEPMVSELAQSTTAETVVGDGYEAPISMDNFPDQFGLIPKNDEGEFDPSKQPLPCDEQFPSSLTELLHYDRDTMQVVKVMHDKWGSKVDIRNLWKGRFTKKGIRLNEDVFERFVQLIPKIQNEMKDLKNKHGFDEVNKGQDVTIRTRQVPAQYSDDDEEDNYKTEGGAGVYSGGGGMSYGGGGGNGGYKSYKNENGGGGGGGGGYNNNYNNGGGRGRGGYRNNYNNNYNGGGNGGGGGGGYRKWPSKKNGGNNYKNNFF